MKVKAQTAESIWSYSGCQPEFATFGDVFKRDSNQISADASQFLADHFGFQSVYEVTRGHMTWKHQE